MLLERPSRGDGVRSADGGATDAHLRGGRVGPDWLYGRCESEGAGEVTESERFGLIFDYRGANGR